MLCLPVRLLLPCSAMDEVSRRIVDNTARRAAAAGGAPKPRFNDQFNFDVMFPQVRTGGRGGA